MGVNERRRRRNVRQLIGLAVAGVLLVGFFSLVQSMTERRSRLKVTFQNPDGSETRPFFLEIASTQGERTKGLMFVKELDPEEGMIFVFPDEDERSFWMKETYVSLDMLFLDLDLKVGGIVPNVPVLNEKGRGVPGLRSKYVIELLAGTAEKAGIKVGSIAKAHGPIPEGIPDRVAHSPAFPNP